MEYFFGTARRDRTGEGGRTNSLATWNNIGIVSTGGTDTVYGYNLTTGKSLWITHMDNVLAYPSVAFVDENGHFYSFDAVTMTYKCYDAQTGAQLWTSDVVGIPPWGDVPEGQLRCEAYGLLYVGSYDGYCRAININTGKIVWQFYVGDTNETVYGTWRNLQNQSSCRWKTLHNNYRTQSNSATV